MFNTYVAIRREKWLTFLGSLKYKKILQHFIKFPQNNICSKNYISWKIKNIDGCGNIKKMVILIKGLVYIYCKFMDKYIHSRALVLHVYVQLMLCMHSCLFVNTVTDIENTTNIIVIQCYQQIHYILKYTHVYLFNLTLQ